MQPNAIQNTDNRNSIDIELDKLHPSVAADIRALAKAESDSPGTSLSRVNDSSSADAPTERGQTNGKAVADSIVALSLDKLLPHPVNTKLFGATSPHEIPALAESIAVAGQQSPLVVTADLARIGFYVILSGHKRAEALRSLGRNEADCQVVDVQDADERLLRLLEANRQHVPTTEQKIRIATVFFELESRRAKARQVAGAKAKKGGEVVEGLTQPDAQPSKGGDATTGKARDLAALKVDLCGVSFEKGRKVVLAIDKAEQDGDNAVAAEMRALLNEKGVEPAHARAKVLDLIQQARRNGGNGKPATKASRGNATNATNATNNSATASTAPEEKAGSAQLVATTSSTSTADPAPSQRNDDSENAGPIAAQKNADTDAGDLPGVRAISLGAELLAVLANTEVADLTADLKHNLARTLEDISRWYAERNQTFGRIGNF